jgi:putative ATP-dependent endonuclease of OLD family
VGEEPHMTIPVSVITDSDVKEYEKNKDNYKKRESNTIQEESAKKITDITARSEENIRFFPALNWTLEFSLFKSTCFSTVFQKAVKSIHTGTDWETDFEKELAKKLINKGLNKTEIAYRIANDIDEDLKKPESDRIIFINQEDATDSIHYLINAIKYATRN